MTRGAHTLRAGVISTLVALASAGAARADTLELADGRKLKGRVLAAGQTRIAFDGEEGGVVFVERGAVRRLLDAQGQPAPLLEGAMDPVAVVRATQETRVQRRGQDVLLTAIGADSVVGQDDVIRTTPYGRVSMVLHTGGMLTARDDAVLRFRQGAPELVEGTLTLAHDQGTSHALLPVGRIVVTDGRATVTHVRGGSQVTCAQGRALVQATEGWAIELPRNHTIEVHAEHDGEMAYVQASNSNAWPLRMEQGGRWISIQPGLRVVIAGALRPSAPPPAPPPLAPPARPEPPLPAPQDLARAPVAPAPPEPEPRRPTSGEMGRVARSTASFALTRLGQTPRRVDAAEAQGLALWSADVLETDAQGEVHLDAAGARVRQGPATRLSVQPEAEGGPAFLLLGEATVATDGRVAVAVPGGEVGLLRGELTLRADADGARVVVTSGTAGARWGDEVSVELMAPAQIDARIVGKKVRLEVPAEAGQAVAATLGTSEVRLRPGLVASHGRTGDLQVLELWTGSRIEMLGAIRATVVAGPEESDLLALDDGTRWRLMPGTYRFVRQGARIDVTSAPAGALVAGPDAVVAAAPTPPFPAPQPLPTPPAPLPVAPTPVAPAAPAVVVPALVEGEQRLVLPNEAVVIARGWGPLVLRRVVGSEVEIEGLAGGGIVLGAKVQVTLTRTATGSTIELVDARRIVHEPGAPALDVRIAADLNMRLATREEALPRTITIEPGCEFDLVVRNGGYFLASVCGQVVYVEAGQDVAVSRSTGLRTEMARRRAP